MQNQNQNPAQTNTVDNNAGTTEQQTQVVENKGTETPNSVNVGGNNQTQVQTDADELKRRQDEYNKEQARLRRERETEKKIKQAEMEAVKRVLNGVNPYTQEPLETELDYEQYKIMKSISDSGGDPLKDYYKHAKNIQVQTQTSQAQEELQRQKVNDDINSFRQKYPTIDVGELLKDNNFNSFADGKWGNQSIVKIYEDYQNLLKVINTKATEKAAQKIANQNAGVGGLGDTQTNTGDGLYTLEELKSMSQEEVRKNYDKVMASYKALK